MILIKSKLYRCILFIFLAYLLSIFFNGSLTNSLNYSEIFQVSESAYSIEEPNDLSLAKERSRLDEHPEAGHSDPFSFILIELALIIVVAMIGRWVAIKFNQPAVLGELLIGVILGNITYWFGSPLSLFIMHLSDTSQIFERVWVSGESVLEAAKQIFTGDQLEPGGIGYRLVQIMTGPGSSKIIFMGIALWLFSNLGVILLLFMVGLESNTKEMLQVGPRATLVAIIGVVCPFILGYGSSMFLLSESSSSVHLFIAATLCATSVGITARVFKDLNRIQTPEAKIILGAAVIDDILGLVILAVVAGIATTGEVKFLDVGRILLLSIIFLGVIILFGERFIRRITPLVHIIDRDNSKLLFPLALAFFLSWIANLIELATIVGAFAAGLILEEEHFAANSNNKSTIEKTIKPLETIFAPIFFVLMGMQVNLGSFLQRETIWIAIALIVVAILGKIVSGIPAGRETDRLSVGLGMIPRGEVGLIFASVGKGLGVISDSIFSAVVIMVIVTTIITPILLKWSLYRRVEGSRAQ